jgi:tRNA A37 threonylcarbamoyladenosine biosynthesis protein TsaE
MSASEKDHMHETWAVFHKNDAEAKQALDKVTNKMAEKYLIVSAKYKFVAKYHDGNIYHFDIYKAKKSN